MTDTRPTLTIKGHQFTPEFRALVNDAARSMNMTQGEFVHYACHRVAMDTLSREGDATNDTRIDRLEDAVDRLISILLPQEKTPDVSVHEIQTPEDREMMRQKSIMDFKALGVEVQPYSDGLILIEGKYVVSLLGRRWRILNRGKWYWYRTPEQLVNQHIKREAV